MTEKRTQFQLLRDDWDKMSIYQRFESLVALTLTAVIGVIILVSLYKLISEVATGLLSGFFDPLEKNAFQAVFAEVLTVMIALEFNHTLQFVASRQQSIIQTKIVLLISLLAIARKVIVLDFQTTDLGQLLGLAALILALGAVYWLMRERDDRLAAHSKANAG
jgi:uncharacterized membrane protein (DUF373 family)